jgi:hypothetical protein
MDAFKIAIKLFVARDVFGPSDFVPVFHRWIQTQALTDHLLIDVADYAHVAAGPGTVLVTSQANLYADRGENRLGLLYARKLPLEGTFRDRLRTVLAETFKAAALLEAEPSMAGRLSFRMDEWLVRIQDRLLAPNTPEIFAAVKPDIEAVTGPLYGGKVQISHKPSALTLFEATVKVAESPSLQVLRDRLGVG